MKKKLLKYQNRIEDILEMNLLDRIEEVSLATTHGWINACIKYNVVIDNEDIEDIETEILIFEEEVEKAKKYLKL